MTFDAHLKHLTRFLQLLGIITASTEMRLVFKDSVLLNTCGSAVIDLGDTAAAASAAAAAAAVDNHELTTIAKATSSYCGHSASSTLLSLLTRLRKMRRKMQVP